MTRILRIKITVARSIEDEYMGDDANDEEMAQMRAICASLDEKVEVSVVDRYGEFLYHPHGKD